MNNNTDRYWNDIKAKIDQIIKLKLDYDKLQEDYDLQSKVLNCDEQKYLDEIKRM